MIGGQTDEQTDGQADGRTVSKSVSQSVTQTNSIEHMTSLARKTDRDKQTNPDKNIYIEI